MWLLADACAFGIILLSTVPDIDLWLGIPPLFLLTVSVGLFGGVLYGSAVGWTPGFFAGRLARPVAVALGTYAFEVYILHMPLLHIFFMPGSGTAETTRSFGARLLFLGLAWAIAAVYANYIQNPLIDRLREHATAWEKRGRPPVSVAKPTGHEKAGAAEPGGAAATVTKPSYYAHKKPRADERTPLQPQPGRFVEV